MAKVTATRGKRFVCRTTFSETVDPRFAVIDITRELLERLQGYKAAYETARGFFGEKLFCVEAFDQTVRFGQLHEEFDKFADAYAEDEAWHAVEGRGSPVDEEEMDTPTLKVIDTGVLWAANEKHGSGTVETPQLTWEFLVAVSVLLRDTEPRRTDRPKSRNLFGSDSKADVIEATDAPKKRRT